MIIVQFQIIRYQWLSSDQSQLLDGCEFDAFLRKGRRYALVTLTERRSRLARLVEVAGKTTSEVCAAITQNLEPLRAQVHTLTSDNSKESVEHADIAR